MERAVDLVAYDQHGATLPSIDDVRGMIVRSGDDVGPPHQPINIQIHFSDHDLDARRRRDLGGFGLFRSKLFWVVLALSLSASVAYARTRYVCQSFKDNGRFFYGMGVDRCVGVLIKKPFEPVGAQLDLINRSY